MVRKSTDGGSGGSMKRNHIAIRTQGLGIGGVKLAIGLEIQSPNESTTKESTAMLGHPTSLSSPSLALAVLPLFAYSHSDTRQHPQPTRTSLVPLSPPTPVPAPASMTPDWERLERNRSEQARESTAKLSNEEIDTLVGDFAPVLRPKSKLSNQVGERTGPWIYI